MKLEQWAQVVFVAVAVLYWLFTALRKLGARDTDRLPDAAPGRHGGPEPLLDTDDVPDVVDAIGELVRRTEAIVRRAGLFEVTIRRTNLHCVTRVFDLELAPRIEVLTGLVRALSRVPITQETFEAIETLSSSADHLEGVLGVLERICAEQGPEGARARAMARVFLDRAGGILGAAKLSSDTLDIVSAAVAGPLGASVLASLARADVLCVDAAAGEGTEPLAWAGLAHQVNAWILVKVDGLEQELSAISGAEPALVRVVFCDVMSSLELGPTWARAIQMGVIDDNPRRAELRRILATSVGGTQEDREKNELDALSPVVQDLVRAVLSSPLHAISKRRIMDDTTLAFSRSDRLQVARTVDKMSRGDTTGADPFHVIVAAMDESLVTAASRALIVEMVDRVLGLLPAGTSPVSSHRERTVGHDDLVSPEAVIQAMVLGAALGPRRTGTHF